MTWVPTWKDEDGIPYFRLMPSTAVANNPSAIQHRFLENGGSADLLVEGSVEASVDFTVSADAQKDMSVFSIGFVLVTSAIKFGENKFGNRNSLSNGMKISIRSGSGDNVDLFTLRRNEDFLHYASFGGAGVVIASKDILHAEFQIGGMVKLVANSSDYLKISVQDDLTSGIDYLRCVAKLIKGA